MISFSANYCLFINWGNKNIILLESVYGPGNLVFLAESTPRLSVYKSVCTLSVSGFHSFLHKISMRKNVVKRTLKR